MNAEEKIYQVVYRCVVGTESIVVVIQSNKGWWVLAVWFVRREFVDGRKLNAKQVLFSNYCGSRSEAVIVCRLQSEDSSERELLGQCLP